MSASGQPCGRQTSSGLSRRRRCRPRSWSSRRRSSTALTTSSCSSRRRSSSATRSWSFSGPTQRGKRLRPGLRISAQPRPRPLSPRCSGASAALPGSPRRADRRWRPREEAATQPWPRQSGLRWLRRGGKSTSRRGLRRQRSSLRLPGSARSKLMWRCAASRSAWRPGDVLSRPCNRFVCVGYLWATTV